jgi:hypothetical protein
MVNGIVPVTTVDCPHRQGRWSAYTAVIDDVAI